MRLLIHLIKNSIKLDLKMLIPFLVTIILIVWVSSASTVSGNLFVQESREPAIIFYGGEVCVYKSSQQALFVNGENGVSQTWYPQLFSPKDIQGVVNEAQVTYDLCIWGKHAFLFQMATKIIGRKSTPNSPQWEIKSGEVPNITGYQEWQELGRPITILIADKLPLEIREHIKIGEECQVFIPKIVESGGVINIKNAYKNAMITTNAEGMDYLDYKNGNWMTFKVAAIGRDGVSGTDGTAVVMPLEFLQKLTGAGDVVNRAGVRTPQGSDDEGQILAEKVTNSLTGFYGLKTTDMFVNSFKSINDLEAQSSLLIYAIYLIGSLMVTCVLILIIRNRRESDVQLITLGINRFTLSTVAIIEITLFSFLAVCVGIIVPVISSMIRSGSIAIDFNSILQYFLIVPFNLLVTIIVTQLMLPNSKQCLEALRNE